MASLVDRVNCLERELRANEETAVALQLTSDTHFAHIKRQIIAQQRQIMAIEQIVTPEPSPRMGYSVESDSEGGVLAVRESLSTRLCEVERRLQSEPTEDDNHALAARVVDLERKFEDICTPSNSPRRKQAADVACQPACGSTEFLADSPRSLGPPVAFEFEQALSQVMSQALSPGREFEVECRSRLEKLELAQSQILEKISTLQQSVESPEETLRTTASRDESGELASHTALPVQEPVRAADNVSPEVITTDLSAPSTLKQAESTLVAMIVAGIERHQAEIPLRESLWEIGLVVGHHGQTWVEAVMTWCLLFILINVNLLVCVILVTQFARNEIDVDAARKWRMSYAHWSPYATSDGRSMAEAICSHDGSLATSGLQAKYFEGAQLYSNLLFGARLGVALCCWCLLIFFFVIWEELQISMNRVLTVWHLPRAQFTHIQPEGQGLALCSLSLPRFILVILFYMMRMAVSLIFLWAGSFWLVYTIDVQDLILNSVALVFVLDIDELLYRIACPSSIKALVESIQPLRKPRAGPYSLPLRSMNTICASILCVALFSLILLRPQFDKIWDLKQTFCGDHTNFIVGTNTATGIVYAYHHNARNQTSSDLMSQVVTDLRADRPQNNHRNSSNYRLFSTYLAMSLDDSVDLYGSETCVDTNDGAMLAALRHALVNRHDVARCQDLGAASCMLNDPIIRLACPDTCGCSLPFSGIFTMIGCPFRPCAGMTGSLLSTPNTQFELAREYLVQHDIDPEVLMVLPEWHLYWDGWLIFQPHFKDHPILSAIEDSGMSRPYVSEMFRSNGCGAFLGIFAKFSQRSAQSLQDFLCGVTNVHQGAPSRRSLKIFCPRTCSCNPTSLWCNTNIVHRRRFNLLSSSSISACPGLRVRSATLIDNQGCKQNLSSRADFSDPVGTYSCSPNAYNGKHVYKYTDQANITWEIKWETWQGFSWAAGILGGKIGLGKRSKWTLSSIDQSLIGSSTSPSPPPPSPFVVCPAPAPSLSPFRCDAPRFFSSSNATVPHQPWFPRNASNTDFDCASGAMTTEILPYALVNATDNSCTVGYARIYAQRWISNGRNSSAAAACEISVCTDAAEAFSHVYGGPINLKTAPTGCIFHHNASLSPQWQVRLNLHPTGVVADANTICVRTSASIGNC